MRVGASKNDCTTIVNDDGIILSRYIYELNVTKIINFHAYICIRRMRITVVNNQP